MKKKHTWITSAHQGVVKKGMHSNTLSSFLLAAQKGADMIETDARRTKDGVLIANHDPIVRGVLDGKPVEVEIADTNSDLIRKIILAPDDPAGIQTVPTLQEILNLVYITGMCINIDLKEKEQDAVNIAKLVATYGMRGRTVYATNGCGTDVMKKIVEIDPDARFIDLPCNYTAENLRDLRDFRKKCFAYTNDFSTENIGRIRESGCMLAAISICKDTFLPAVICHPDMMEYPHTGDFEVIEREGLEKLFLSIC